MTATTRAWMQERTARRLTTACACALAALVLSVDAAAQPLTQVQYRLTGLSVDVSPTALTVPRGIPTQLNTTIGGAPTLPSGASIRATLRGPSFPNGIPLTATPGQPLLLPAFATPGLHFVENIAMDVGPGSTIAASPTSVTVNVLDEILVGAVSSRPLSLDEIRALGIVFDESSFQAFSFTIAMTTASGIVDIEFPVLVPLTGGGRTLVGGDIPSLATPRLPSLQLPNVAIEAIALEPIDDLPSGVRAPTITGILVIPGTVAFLNQFYSVMLTVTNQAPNGTPLVVRDLNATISLPPGPDGVTGDITRDPPFVPGEPEFDNPLRLARTAAGRERVKPIRAAGPDGAFGTPDDIDRLGPQGSGNAEFLVEGVREGGHVIDIEMSGILDGLPSGPVEVRGRTSGSVVVRDPTFSLTFIHPNTVRAGEAYDLIVQIQNTSLAAANLVTVRLDPRNLTGARLLNPADASRVIDTIPAGEAGSVTFRLEALRTGKVTATTLEITGDDGAVTGRRFSLRAGVGELGTPLSPDTLLLPPSVGSLRERAGNDDLTFRAIALLGQAHSIATSPRGSLSAGVLPIAPADVIQRALELSEAGLRLELSVRDDGDGVPEPIPQGLLLTLQDLYFDFLGAGAFNDGWDALYRRSRQARLFGSALADVAARETETLGIGDFIALQRHWADTESYRDHATVMIHSAGGELPAAMTLVDRLGRRLGGALDPLAGFREIPGADVLTLEPLDTVSAQFAALTRLDSGPYTGTIVGTAAGSIDLGFVVPGSGGLRHVTFRGVAIDAGDRLALTLRPRSAEPVALERNGVAILPTADDLVPDAPPEVLGIVQRTDENIDKFGRVVAVLFSEDVDPASAEVAAAYAVSNASIAVIPPPPIDDSNRTNAALPQFGSRIIFLGLRDPVGPFVTRRLSVSGVRDLRGQTMNPLVDHTIVSDPNIGPGAVVTGRVLRPDGTAVETADVTYVQFIQNRLGQLVEHVITIKPADEDGRYSFDFVLQNPDAGFIMRARDPASAEEASLTTRVRANGERLTLDLVLLGRGTVEGTVRDRSGAAIAGAIVTVRSLTDLTTQQVQTDQHGVYRVTGVPVGPVGVEAVAPQGRARASGAILTSGSAATVDVVIFGAATGVVTGEVRLPSGAPAARVIVHIAPAATGGGAADAAIDAVQSTDTGTFRFEGITSGEYVVIALDHAFGLAGQARFTVTPFNDAANPAFVLVLMAGTGSVSGQVLEVVSGSTVPVPGALVAGGTEIVTADAEGRYFIPAVPVGVRTIEAANPASGAQGSRQVTILVAGQVSTGIDIVLNPLGRVTGHVLDPAGLPVAGQEVRIIIGETMIGEGRRFFVRRTTTAADGSYSFERLEPREYPISAVRGDEVANGVARLGPLALHDIVNLRFIRSTGRVSGRVVDDSGLAVAAQVTIRARVPNGAGVLEFRHAGTTTNDPDRGFTFARLFPGPFTLEASSFFSPGTATASGVLPEASPVAENITLTLARNTGRLQGCVLAPDGTAVPPVLDEDGVPRPLSVFITSRLLRNELENDGNPEPDGIRVDASTGCFTSSIPLPPDFYTIQVTDDRPGSATLGLTGQATAVVERGADATQDVRLLGLGAIGVEVVDASGAPLRGIRLTARRTTYPNDARDALVLPPTVGAPVPFDGLTEGPIAVTAVVSTDPAVDVGGRDDLRGFGGTANGAVVRGATTVIRVTVDAAGTVSGRFLRPGGTTEVANAQVTLATAPGDTLFAVTDAAGSFRFEGVPRGAFRLEGFEPASGRRARARGEVEIDGQHVVAVLELGPIGRVHGTVVDATRTHPIPGADVRLLIPEEGTRDVTSRPDGTFAFESVPGGTVTVTAVSSDGLAGRGEATIAAEGDDLDVLVALEGSGGVQGIVRDAFGVPVAAADVALITASGVRRVVQAGPPGPDAGTFGFSVVPLGSFTIEARPPGALTPGDGGRNTGVLDAAGDVVTTDVAFQGTITVGASVTGASGPNPVNVTLESVGLFGGTMVPTTVEGGVYVFAGVPRAPLTVSARQVAPSGATLTASAAPSEGELPPAGQRLTPDMTLSLNQLATVAGRVLGENGQPVALARVTLITTELTVVAPTGADGTFNFVGVPLSSPLRLDAEDAAGGRAVFTGSVDAAGVVRDSQGLALDSVPLTLDATPPRVQAVTPPQGATAVSTGTTITIAFSEPIDPSTIATCPASPGGATIRLLESSGAPPDPRDPAHLCDDSNVVPLALAIAPDARTVTLTPQRSLASVTQHTVVVSHGSLDGDGVPVGGVRDRIGLPLAADFVSQFVTLDDVPPRVLAASPAPGSVNVPEDSVVRVTFSEPVLPASVTPASVALSGPLGAVAASRTVILGNTVVVLTPVDDDGNRRLLDSNTTYTITVGGVVDPAGNVQRPQDSIVATFATRDTLAPSIASLDGPAGARAGQQIVITARSAASDVASVEFLVDGIVAAVSSTPIAPGEFRTPLTMPAHAIEIAARATDTSGNVGPASAAVVIPLLPDNPPAIAITEPAPGTTVSAGTTVRFGVQATDDSGVAELRGATSGAVTTVDTRVIAPPLATASAFFEVSIPANVTGGAVTFATAATDTAGQTSATASVTVSIAPAVARITSVHPPVGNQGATLDVAIAGQFTSFAQGVTTASFGAGVTVNSVTVFDNRSASVNVTIDADAPTGSRTVTLTTSDEVAMLVGGFTVQPGLATVASVNPIVGDQGQNLTVVLNGRFTHFVQGQTTASFGPGIAAGTVTVNSPTLASVPIVISTAAATGPRTVTVQTNAEVATLPDGFTVLPGTAAIAVIGPNTGRTNQSLPVTITGVFTNWQNGVTTASFGPDISVGSAADGAFGPVTVTSPTTLTAELAISALAPLGPRTVSVRTGDETLTVNGGFTVTEVDTTAPAVLTTSPPDAVGDVPLNTEVVVEFNEPVDRATVTTGATGSFILVDGTTGDIVPATVAVDAAGRVATLVPSQLLGVGRGFAVFLSQNASITDTSGNVLPRTIFSFATGFATETAGPMLLATSPADGDSGVPLNAAVMLRFSRTMNPISRAAGLHVTRGGEPVPGTYVFSDANRLVTFTAVAPLAPDTLYSVVVTAALRDAAGNDLVNAGTFGFTTGAEADGSPPAATALSPSSGDAAVAANAVVRVRFNEPINPLTATFHLVHGATGQIQRASVALDGDRRGATLTPSSLMLTGTRYVASIGVSDRAGNATSFTWSFVTASRTDHVAPVVTSFTPAEEAVGVAVNARVSARMNEPIDPISVGDGSLTLSPAVAGTVALSQDRTTVTFTPASVLNTSTTYVVSLTGLRDAAGNMMAPATSSFTTRADPALDLTAPTVVSTAPAHGATDVAVNELIEIALSEPIRAGAVSSSSISVFALVSGNFVQIAGDLLVDGSHARIVFTPLGGYPGGTSIWVNVNNDGTIADAAGNALEFAQVVFTTAAVADATAPVVTSVTPLDGATGVGLNTTVVLTFSEPLHPATVHGGTFALFAGSTLLGTDINRSADNRTVSLTAVLPPSTPIAIVVTGGVTDVSGNHLADFVSTFTTGTAVDAGRPMIVTQRPGNGATFVPASTTITLYATEPLDSATAASALRVSQNGAVMAGSVVVTGHGTALQFTPDVPFAAGALVHVFLDASATDTAGNALQPFFGQFTIAPDTAATAPQPVRVSPLQTSGVPRNAVFELEFNEPLDAATVDAATVRLVDASSAVVASTVSLRGDRTIRLVPAAPLEPSSAYVFTVTTGVADRQGTAMVFDFDYGVSTAGAVDLSRPSVAAVTPPRDASDVGINALIRVSFSEPVNPLTVDGATIRVSGGPLTLMPASISFNITNTEVTITPLEAMPGTTTMTVAIAGVEDAAGNPVTPSTVTFTTRAGADTEAPAVVETNLTSGQLNVPVNTVFTIHFSEPMDAQSINPATITLVDQTTGARAPAVVSLSADGRIATLAPTAPLAVGRGYSLLLSGRDLAGNPLPFLGFFAHAFVTAFAGDATPPQVVASSPVDGDLTIPTNARIEVLFDEPVQPTSVAQAALLTSGLPIPATVTLSNGNRTLSIVPGRLLRANTAYVVSIASVKDASGNIQVGTFAMTFTTGAGADLIGPAITALNPAAGDIVGRNAVIRVQFSERMNPLSIDATTFRLSHQATGRLHAATLEVAADRLSATLTPLEPLLPGAHYTVQINATDLAGFAAGTGWGFTTAAIDATAPTVVAQTPADGAADVPVNARFVARLSEPIDRTSVNAGVISLSPALAGSVTLAADRVTLTFTPAAPLEPAASYLVTVSGLRDATGNTMVPSASRFSTAADATPDAVAPFVTSVTPAHGSTGVPVTSPIVIALSEPIRSGAVHDSSVPVYALIDGTSFVQLAALYEVDTTQTQITVTPLAPYPGNTSIWININNDGTIADAAGNQLSFLQSVFTTAAAADTSAPAVTSATPADGASGVGPNTTIVLTFSEPVDPQSVHAGTVALFAGVDQLTLQELNRSADNRTVFAVANLPERTRITLVATAGIVDLSGNQLIDFVSSFTTSDAVDAGLPHVVTMRPGSGATAVPRSATITLLANEALDPATVPGALRVSENGVLVAGTVTVTGTGTAVRFAPVAPFAANALVQVFLLDTATDMFGNRVQAFFGQFSTADDAAATAPQLVRVSPPQSGELPINAVFDLEFNEPLDAATVNAASVRLVDGASNLIDATISLRSGGRIIHIVPAAPLAPMTGYAVLVTTAVRDLQGAPLAFEISYGVTTGDGIDVAPPAVAGVTPPAGASSVGVNALVRVRFSEPINPLTVDAASIHVSGGSQVVMPASISFNVAHTEVTITPLEAMPEHTEVTIAVAGVEDWAGNPVTPLATIFTTGPGADTTAPAIAATSFINGQGDVPVNAVVTVDFSEPMDPQSISVDTTALVDHATGAPVTAAVSLSADGRTLTLTPTVPLEAGHTYSLLVSGRDLAGNGLPFFGLFSYFFTTSSFADTTAPVVVATNPGDGHFGVPRNVRLQVLFDGAIDATSLRATTLHAGAAPVPITPVVAADNRALTVAAGAPLLPNTTYTLRIAAVRDIAGNSMAGEVVVTFTTAGTFDLTPPGVVSLLPENGSTDVPAGSAVEIAFDEPMNPLTLLGGTMVLRVTNTGASVQATITPSADHRTFRLTPAAPLDPGTQYTCAVTFGIADRAGNPLNVAASTTFTTQP